MKTWALVMLCITSFYSCKKKSSFDGFSLTKTGLDYKIHTIGEPNVTIHDSDVVGFHYSVYNVQDSLLYQSQKTVLYRAIADTGLNELLGLLALEDSASAIIGCRKTDGFYPFSTHESVVIRVRVTSVVPYYSWAFNQKYPELAMDLEIDEQVKLQQYLLRFKLDSLLYTRGVFIIQQVAGVGDVAQKGEEVMVHYAVRNMANKTLDSTWERDEPFSYIIGEKDQVIEGFDIGVRKMRVGEKALIIVPSKKGFGSKGSSTGIVKSYQSLIYEVEVLAINSRKD